MSSSNNFWSLWRQTYARPRSLATIRLLRNSCGCGLTRFLTDDYYASDIAWLDLENPKFDVVFAPYEVYDDSLLGVKTTYGASVMIRNDAESEKLALYQKYVPDLQEALPLPAADLPSKRGKQSPMEVVDSPYRAGDLLHGYQAVADNLPNDPRIHEAKGSKKIFWKNFMDARVNYIILPLAQRTMRADQAAMASGEGYLADTIMHEISHGLGPAFAHTAQGKVQINEAIGSSYSALEESKADVVGEFCYGWLIDHGVLPKERRNITYASYVAGIFRTVRFGVAEAHGAGEIMQFNYYFEQGAISRDAATGLYVIDLEKMPAAIASLAKELLEQEATGDRARTDAWFKKYGTMPAELSALLAKTSDIPVDIDPGIRFPSGAQVSSLGGCHYQGWSGNSGVFVGCGFSHDINFATFVRPQPLKYVFCDCRTGSAVGAVNLSARRNSLQNFLNLSVYRNMRLRKTADLKRLAGGLAEMEEAADVVILVKHVENALGLLVRQVQ